jgi:hypothetical protein
MKEELFDLNRKRFEDQDEREKQAFLKMPNFVRYSSVLIPPTSTSFLHHSDVKKELVILPRGGLCSTSQRETKDPSIPLDLPSGSDGIRILPAGRELRIEIDSIPKLPPLTGMDKKVLIRFRTR